MRHFQLGGWALMMVLLITGASPAQADHEITLFFNNFDTGAVGTLPAPWQMISDGAGVSSQGVSREYAFSGAQSLKLVGRHTWWSMVQRPFKTGAPVVGTQFYIRFGKDLSTIDQPLNEGETPGLFCLNSEWYLGSYYGVVMFDHLTKKIKKPILQEPYYQDLQSWLPDTWYKVRALADRVNHRAKVWINDTLVLDDQMVGASKLYRTPLLHPEMIDALALVAGHAGGPVYYDNVRVFLPGVQEMGVLAKEDVDRVVLNYMSATDAAAVKALKGKIDEALENELVGEHNAAIENLTDFLAEVERLAGTKPISLNKIPPLTTRDHDNLARKGEQMIIQIQYYKNKS